MYLGKIPNHPHPLPPLLSLSGLDSKYGQCGVGCHVDAAAALTDGMIRNNGTYDSDPVLRYDWGRLRATRNGSSSLIEACGQYRKQF